MKNGVMTDNEKAVFNYVKECGGKTTVAEMVDALGRTSRSLCPNLNTLSKEGIIVKTVAGEGDEKITYVELTDEGKVFVPAEKAE